jgi:hypothetical protein
VEFSELNSVGKISCLRRLIDDEIGWGGGEIRPVLFMRTSGYTKWKKICFSYT